MSIRKCREILTWMEYLEKSIMEIDDEQDIEALIGNLCPFGVGGEVCI